MTGQVLRVLIAPDCFGDSLTAVEAADAIAAGWSRGRRDDALTLAPQSDGGPGFVDVLAATLGERRRATVRGPLDADVTAEWLFDAGANTAYLECAQACGLALLPDGPTTQTAVAAHSTGVGQLIDAALQAGARRIVVGLGGSACTDGGRGLVEALGGLRTVVGRLGGIELVAATDVEHRLLGASGAAWTFGPQKGADPDTVALLEQRLTEWAAELAAGTGHDVRAEPGSGAAGGLGAALLALGARRRSGAAIVAERTGLPACLAAAQLLITGEGRFDEQSLHGKVISALAAGAGGTPVVVLAGQVTLDAAALRSAGITVARSLSEHAGSVQRAIDDAARQLTDLAWRTATEWSERERGE